MYAYLEHSSAPASFNDNGSSSGRFPSGFSSGMGPGRWILLKSAGYAIF